MDANNTPTNAEFRFTDEQIDELTKTINYNNSMGSYFESPIKNDALIAILRRLEAAEKAYLLYRNDSLVRHTPEQVEAGLFWRKVSGKGQ